MKKELLFVVVSLQLILVGCNQSVQNKEVSNSDIVLPNPNLGLELYCHEDVVNATDKIKKAFSLTGQAVKMDDWHDNLEKDYIEGSHYYYLREVDSIEVKYHIYPGYDKDGNRHEEWFDYLAIILSSSRPNAFDVMQHIADSLNVLYDEHKDYEWDEQESKWTNGQNFVFIQSPTRDEQKNNVYMAITLRPIEQVKR